MAFSDIAEVVYPGENCRFTSYVLRNIADWADELGIGEDISLVHWNAGLWDDLIMIDGKLLIDADTYAENIGRIDVVIRKLFPNAKFIFATSTPVQEHLFETWCYKRYNSDTERYNALAVQILESRGVLINDLYSLLKDAPSEYHSDLTHYCTKEGTQLIADAVISCIAKSLGITAKKLDYNALFNGNNDVIGV